jgi:hypothetical protein
MTKQIDFEIEAIKKLLTALEPLEAKARESVLDYIIRRLDIRIPVAGEEKGHDQRIPPSQLVKPSERLTPTARNVHIKDLKEQKQPRSAIEMAALVAYYLSEVAPENERKKTITKGDIETYFKIAEFKLPSKPQFTLVNAKGSGYFDALGKGQYKLNAVGYNLVTHSMPRVDKSPKQGKGKPVKKTLRSSAKAKK